MGLRRRISWSAPAEEELDRLLSYIDYENPVAAKRLWALVMDALETAAEFPELAPHVPGLAMTYREILAVRPFRIIYRLEGPGLQVIAVMRQEQDFDPMRFVAT